MKNFTKILSVLTGIIINSNISFSQAPTNGLVAYYPFSGNANDASGNGRNGTIAGGVTASADRYGNVGQAYSFDGVNGNITVDDWSLLQGNAARTLSVWFKTNQNTSSYYMISWGNPGHTTNTGSILGISAQPAYSYLGFFGINNDLSLLNAAQYFDDRWHLMSFTYDGNTMNLYLDGVSQNTKTNSPLNTGSSNLIIGSYVQNSNYFNGQLDEVRIYDRALTAAEIQQMYAAEVVTSVADVIKFGPNKFIHATGIANIFAGVNAGSNTTGANNTFFGNKAGLGIISGQGNIFIGSSSNSYGDNIGTLQRSGAIGYNARVSVNDAIVLGDFENLNIKIGIGVHDPQYRLDVKGVINMRTAYNSPGIKMNGKNFLELDNEGEFLVSNFKVKYDNVNEWPDGVFDSTYKIQPIEEVTKFARENKHLPNIPTAEEVVKNGVEMQDIVAKLLKKIEELTLYIGEQNKINKQQADEIKQLKDEVNVLKITKPKE
ncbi:LamG domain-containing protein [Emticicia sp. 17c]|uniref:LamG domain-containing protein n=1 Tax=Emticicia sp. 17c TaxID=3127704 RepID=UPI00301C2C7F